MSNGIIVESLSLFMYVEKRTIPESFCGVGIIGASMVDAENIYLKDVPVVVDVTVTDNWFEK